jgi:hypothetical protein
VETDADAEFDSPDELRVGWRRNGREVSGTSFSID